MSDSMTLKMATEIISAAEEKTKEIDQPIVITVVNDEGNLIAQHRMDDAWLASVEISRNKAYTSAALKMSTDSLAEMSQPGESLYGLQTTDNGRIVTFGGDYPLISEKIVLGAIGVSGGAVDRNMAVAQAGVERFVERH